MGYHKTKLLALIIAGSYLGFINQVFFPTSVSDDFFDASWVYWLGMAVLAYSGYYGLTLKCPNPECGKLQIFRGDFPQFLHLPEDNCYVCGTRLNKD